MININVLGERTDIHYNSINMRLDDNNRSSLFIKSCFLRIKRFKNLTSRYMIHFFHYRHTKDSRQVAQKESPNECLNWKLKTIPVF